MKRKVKSIVCLLLISAGMILVSKSVWIKGKALLAGLLLRGAWEQTVSTGQPVKAWPWADSRPIARMRVDRLGVDSIILEGDSGEVLAFGPGHITGSARPLANGNCVLVGHRDTSFNFLKNLERNDLIVISDDKNQLGTYMVQSTAIVSVSELYFKSTDEAWLTIITCYPFDAVLPGSDKRYVVFASLVET